MTIIIIYFNLYLWIRSILMHRLVLRLIYVRIVVILILWTHLKFPYFLRHRLVMIRHWTRYLIIYFRLLRIRLSFLIAIQWNSALRYIDKNNRPFIKETLLHHHPRPVHHQARSFLHNRFRKSIHHPSAVNVLVIIKYPAIPMMIPRRQLYLWIYYLYSRINDPEVCR